MSTVTATFTNLTSALTPSSAPGPSYVSPDALRTRFSTQLSSMYKEEVPLYGDLIELVTHVNQEVLYAADTSESEKHIDEDNLMRLTLERHGAIRVGTPAEFAILTKIFVLLGMSPVGFYDLSECGLPIRATAFRPIGEGALQRNPFRVFTSLLQLDLIPDVQIRELASSILQRRKISSGSLDKFLDRVFAQAERGKRPVLSEQDAAIFIPMAIDVFRWHSTTKASKEDYEKLKEVHPLVADICCFAGPHINHLTPRTLDIDAVQADMNARGINAKEVIEGPPRRLHNILLRQTSFKALEEPVYFMDEARPDSRTLGHHTARFGEIESRGMALTRKGLQLYRSLFATFQKAEEDGVEEGTSYQQRLKAAFTAFPDDLRLIREQGLAYFSFSLEGQEGNKDLTVSSITSAHWSVGSSLDCALAQHGLAIRCDPITYEDFLPQSAAGIFASNLAPSPLGESSQSPCSETQLDDVKKKEFEDLLGLRICDYFDLYDEARKRSIQCVADRLGIPFGSAYDVLVVQG